MIVVGKSKGRESYVARKYIAMRGSLEVLKSCRGSLSGFWLSGSRILGLLLHHETSFQSNSSSLSPPLLEMLLSSLLRIPFLILVQYIDRALALSILREQTLITFGINAENKQQGET
jgi:hypothetical protein